MMRTFERLLNPWEAAPRNGLFGGGGGGDAKVAQFLAAQQLQQQQAAIRDAQGRQMAELTKQQAEADNEAASMKKPGLGRAMLMFSQRRGSGAQPLGV